MEKLATQRRLYVEGDYPRYLIYHDDFPFSKIVNPWDDTAPAQDKTYVVQTNDQVVARCLLMATDPGDLVFDPTCGSGTTSFVSEQLGRRWITCDTSRVAITLTKQRLLTANFEYYELSRADEGIGSGFKYETIKHTTLKSIVNDDPPQQEILYDRPIVERNKVRVAGPFTVEAVPAPLVKPISEITECESADESISRSGETLRQNEWRDELFKTGIRGHGGQKIECSRVEPLKGTRYLHAEAETKDKDPKRMVVSFGPQYAPLEQRQVALALEEAQKYIPKPQIVAFAAFEFDPEAAKDIDETKWPGVTLLKFKMNADLLTEDLKKKRSSNESFWLIGQPDIKLFPSKKVSDKGKYQVEILGFDYYNTLNGNIESGGKDKIAMWLLDTDYDGRSLFPRQVFFPMEGEDGGWAKLAKNLKAELDEDLIEKYRGTLSVPFEPGENNRIAIKIIDNRGIESLKIIEIE